LVFRVDIFQLLGQVFKLEDCFLFSKGFLLTKTPDSLYNLPKELFAKEKA